MNGLQIKLSTNFTLTKYSSSSFSMPIDEFELVMCMLVGMDILGHLCQVEQNETLLAENLDTIVYENIVRMLTLHDIQLIVFTLETLYQLSELGELASTCIAHARTAVGECRRAVCKV